MLMQIHALHLLANRRSIFPIQPLSKRPLISWKEFQDRLPDREEVIEWYTRWPDAGIAVALGPVSGIVVVDVDSVAAEQVLIDLLGDRPQTRKAYSGSLQPGKVHYYFRDPEFETTA
ncbi:MAG: bifunctional DNA primase/polymerase, partial [Planctomycetaceae bacterium]|nr:bifunctional DNA primase/polymerase [Planctomycetaceae bacterium]